MRTTAVYTNPLFLAHDTGRGHTESSERLREVYRDLNRQTVAENLVFPEFTKATTTEILRNHTREHIRAIAATARHEAYYLDADTRTSAESYEAACLAVGAVIDGVGRLGRGEIDNGFCLVRPPGHHAERDQAMGFCLFNNVAIGARWAKKHLGLTRILILDWDLHHGNGTQHAFYRDDSVLYCSIHQYPLYPGSGALPEIGEGRGRGYTVNIPLAPGHGDMEYARLCNDLIAPMTRAYKPELILISCGFDCMAGDPLGAMRLTTAGIAYLTRMMVELATELCQGRLLLTLEGGYDVDNVRTGTLAVLGELCGRTLTADQSEYLRPEEAKRLCASSASSDSINQAMLWIGNWWPLNG